jgi:hypothetical protein
MMRSDRDELLVRVQKATGPDRELDVLIAGYFGSTGPNGLIVCAGFLGVAEFTASIDAALALVERVLPGNYFLVMRDTGQWEANIGPQESFVSFEGKCSNAPLSILAALLTALKPPEAP